jgi:hypothetical protein
MISRKPKSETSSGLPEQSSSIRDITISSSLIEKSLKLNGKTVLVLMEILLKDAESKGSAFILLKNGTVSKMTFYKSLNELESSGLIHIDRVVGKSPRIRVIR